MSDTIFHRIMRREIPAEIVLEDEHLIAFRDIAPQAPVHVLFVPKRDFATLNDVPEEHAVVIVTEDGRGRVLIDPVALDPAGTTTLDAWQPSKEGDLVAYQVSSGGTEESVLHVLDVATGEAVDGPIDRAR